MHSNLKKSNLLICLTLWLWLSHASVGQVNPAAFQYATELPVAVESLQPVRVALNREWLQHSGIDQRGIRIVDDLGREIPWVTAIQSGQQLRETKHPLEIRGYERTDVAETILLRSATGRIVLNEIRFNTRSRDFRRSVQVFGSMDSHNWKLIGEGIIYDASERLDFRQLAISCDETELEWVKLVLDLAVEQWPSEWSVQLGDRAVSVRSLPPNADVRFDTLSGAHVRNRAIAPIWNHWEFPSPRFSIDPDGNSIFSIGELNVPVDKLTVSTPQAIYSRSVYVQNSSDATDGNFRNVISGTIEARLNNEAPRNEIIGNVERLGNARIFIENARNPALEIDAITLSWFQREVVFIAEPSRSYSLLAGSADAGVKRYDLARLISVTPESLDVIAVWNAPSPANNPAWDPSLSQSGFWSTANRERAMTVLVVMIAIALGAWLFHLLKERKQQ